MCLLCSLDRCVPVLVEALASDAEMLLLLVPHGKSITDILCTLVISNEQGLEL